jgi:hypothetical protein
MATSVDDRTAVPLLTEGETPPAPPPTPAARQPGHGRHPTVIAGAISLGLTDTGYLSATASGAALPS